MVHWLAEHCFYNLSLMMAAVAHKRKDHFGGWALSAVALQKEQLQVKGNIWLLRLSSHSHGS